MDELLTRRSTLLRLAGLVGAGLGIDALEAGRRPGGSRLRRRQMRAHARADRRPVLHRRTRRSGATSPRAGAAFRSRCTRRSSTRRRASRSKARRSTSGTATPAASTRASAQGASNRTFLRGMQRTNANGLAVLKTIYPGWYQGRTVHIHVKVHVGGNVVHTGQLYFPDTLTDKVYRKAPYKSRPGRTTRNSNDFVFANGGKNSMLSVQRRRRRRLCRVDHDGRRQNLGVERGEALGLLVELALRVARQPLERLGDDAAAARSATCPRRRRRRGTSRTSAASS